MSWRSLFEIPDGVAYFNAAYLSPIPVASAQSGVDALERRTRAVWDVGAEDFFTPSEKLRSLIAPLWGTLPTNIALVPSVSYGVETAAKNFALREGDILMPADEFPSNVYPWAECAKREPGLRLVFVPRPADDDWTRAFLERMSPQTALVSVPTTDWSYGTRFDLPALSKRCKELGARFVVDASQSFGAVPFSVSDFDPDFLFSVGYKWQLGPYGLSYLYVADRWHNGQPLENNWITRRSSEDFSRLIEYKDEYQSGARRFDAGQRSQFHLTPIALESMRLFADVGIPKIHAHVRELQSEIQKWLSEMGFTFPRIEMQSGHLVGARHHDWPDIAPLVKKFREHRVFVSARGSALRISPHLYNTPEDVEHLVAAFASEFVGG